LKLSKKLSKKYNCDAIEAPSLSFKDNDINDPVVYTGNGCIKSSIHL
jgi:hypothetical protein